VSTLRIDWATHEATKFACENWHYSRCLPTGKLVKIGAWEGDDFIGVVVFSRGASPHLLTKYDLSQYEGCELTRIALKGHRAPVSKILSVALRFLREKCPGVRLIVSFADPEQGHHGGVYQATNWLYTGESGETIEYLVEGRWRHVRGSYHIVKGREAEFPTRTRRGKHRYLYFLDESLRQRFNELRRPYPKRVESKAIVAPSFQEGEGGETPTSTLQTQSSGEK